MGIIEELQQKAREERIKGGAAFLFILPFALIVLNLIFIIMGGINIHEENK